MENRTSQPWPRIIAERVHSFETGATWWQVSTPGPMIARCTEDLAKRIDELGEQGKVEEAWAELMKARLEWRPAAPVPVIQGLQALGELVDVDREIALLRALIHESVEAPTLVERAVKLLGRAVAAEYKLSKEHEAELVQQVLATLGQLGG